MASCTTSPAGVTRAAAAPAARVFTWGSNKNASLGIGLTVRQAQPSLAGAVPVQSVPASRTKGRGAASKSSAAVSSAVSLFERQIRKELQDSQKDDESLRPEHRAAAAATARASGSAQPLPNPLSGLAIIGVACGEQHTLCCDRLGDVYSWGRTREGQCGHGAPTTAAQQTPRRIELLGTTRARSVHAGAYHSLAISAQRALYCWGLHHEAYDSGTLQFFGVGNFSELKPEHQAMIEESHIAYYDGQTDVASASADPAEAEAQLELAAAEPSADQAVAQAVGEGGGAEGGGEPEAEIAAAVIPEEAGDSVYYYAENVGQDRTTALRAQHEKGGTARGEISGAARPEAAEKAAAAGGGGGRKMAFRRKSEFKPRRVGGGSWEQAEGACTVLGVGAGYCFTLVVVERVMPDGRAVREGWAWGINEKGQLGLGHRWIVDSPERIEGLPADLEAMAAGHQHAVAALRSGGCLTWGLGVFGQLGHGGAADSLAPVPVPAQLCHDIEQVACGSYHTLFLQRGGRLLACGHAEYGQLGTMEVDEEGEAASHVRSVQPVEGLPPEPVVSIACGWLHSMAVTGDGRLLTFGWGSAGVLGHAASGLDKGFAWYRLGQAATVTAFGSQHVVGAAGGWKHCAAVVSGHGSGVATATAGLGLLLFRAIISTDAGGAALAGADLELRFAGGAAHKLHQVVAFSQAPGLHRLACRAAFAAGCEVNVPCRALLGKIKTVVDGTGNAGGDRVTGTVGSISPLGDRALVVLHDHATLGGVWVDLRDLEAADGGEAGRGSDGGAAVRVVELQPPGPTSGGEWRAGVVSAAVQYLYTEQLAGGQGLEHTAQLEEFAMLIGNHALAAAAFALLPKRTRAKRATVARPPAAIGMHGVLLSPWRYGADCVIDLGDGSGESAVYWAHKSAYLKTVISTAVGRSDNLEPEPEATQQLQQRIEMKLKDFSLPAGEFDRPTFETVLTFCYAGAEPGLINESNAVKLLCVADALVMPELKLECETLIEFEFLDRANAGQLLELCACSPTMAPRLALACQNLLDQRR